MNIKKIWGKAIIFLLVLSLGFLGTVSPIYADSSKNPKKVPAIATQGVTYEVDGVTYTFASTTDRDSFIKMYKQSTTGITTFSDVQTTSTKTGSRYYPNAWVNYVTSVWSNHTSFNYSIGTEFSASMSASYEGIGYSVSAKQSYSIGGSIYADKTRQSRLAMWQSYTVTNYRAVTTGGYGSYVINTFTYSSVAKVGAPIINPVYKTGNPTPGKPYPY